MWKNKQLISDVHIKLNTVQHYLADMLPLSVTELLATLHIQITYCTQQRTKCLFASARTAECTVKIIMYTVNISEETASCLCVHHG